MRVLVYRYNSICEPDIIDSLKMLGHECDTVDFEITHKNAKPSECINALAAKLSEKSYDAIFTINYFPYISKIATLFHIRYISWTVDSPVMELWADMINEPWNRIFIFDKSEYLLFKDKNPGKIFHMPLAGNVRRLDALFDSLGGQRRFAEDISFVGSLYNEKNPIMALPDIRTSWLGGYLRGMCEIQSRLYGGFILEDVLTEEVINEIKTSLPDYYNPPENYLQSDRFVVAAMYLAPWATTIERERIVQILYKNFKFGLYTRSDLSHLAVRGKGAVSSLVEMPQVFKNSVININMTHKGIRSGIPQRVFDIMSAGGFMLTSYQPEIFELFTPGEDFDFFANDDELLEKCVYYLNHKQEAKEIARNAYEKVKENYSYVNRMDEILKLAFSV